MPAFIAFLYKGNASRLFNDASKYDAAIKEGWTDRPTGKLKEVEAQTVLTEAKPIIGSGLPVEPEERRIKGRRTGDATASAALNGGSPRFKRLMSGKN